MHCLLFVFVAALRHGLLSKASLLCAEDDATCQLETGAALKLVQVLAKARRGNSSRSMPSAAVVQLPDWVEQQRQVELHDRGGSTSGNFVTRSGLSTEAYTEALSGIWDCDQSRYTGLKTLYIKGETAIIHTGCKAWQGFFRDGVVNVTDPPWVANTHCYLMADGKMHCGPGDVCTKVDRKPPWKVTPPDDRYAGKWQSVDGDGTENSTFEITQHENGELLYQAPQNLSGYLYPTNDGYVQAEVCQGGIVTGASMRFKLSKSKRNVQSNAYIPQMGMTDWGPQSFATKVGKESNFPWTLVAIPLVAIMFGAPASLFFLGAEGRGGPAKKPDAMAKSKKEKEAGKEKKEKEVGRDEKGRVKGEISTSMGGL